MGKWELDGRGRWLRAGGESVAAGAPRFEKVLALLLDRRAYETQIPANLSWSHELTVALFEGAQTLGLNWPALTDLVNASREHERRRVAADGVEYEVVAAAPAQTVKDFTVCQVKQRAYSVLKHFGDEKSHKYDVKADEQRRRLLAERYQVASTSRVNEAKLREALAYVQQLGAELKCMPAQAKDSLVTEQLVQHPETGALSNAYLISDPSVASILRDLTSAASLMDTLLNYPTTKQPGGSVALCSSLIKQSDEAIQASLNAKGSKHKDTHEVVQKLLKAARDDPEINADGVRSSDHESLLTPAQYFVAGRFAPYIFSLECLEAYAATLQEACLLAILQRQLKSLDTMKHQWVERLTDVRKVIRTTKKPGRRAAP